MMFSRCKTYAGLTSRTQHLSSYTGCSRCMPGSARFVGGGILETNLKGGGGGPLACGWLRGPRPCSQAVAVSSPSRMGIHSASFLGRSLVLQSGNGKEGTGEEHSRTRRRTAPAGSGPLGGWSYQRSPSYYNSANAGATGDVSAAGSPTRPEEPPDYGIGTLNNSRRSMPSQPMRRHPTLPYGRASHLDGAGMEFDRDTPRSPTSRSDTLQLDAQSGSGGPPGRPPSGLRNADQFPSSARSSGSSDSDGTVRGADSGSKDGAGQARSGDSGNGRGRGGSSGVQPRPLSYSQRVALLRKPALTAADKTALSPEERTRIYRALRTPRGPVRNTAAVSGTWGGSHQSSSRPQSPAPAPPRLPLPLRVFCYGIDDVRMYRALEGAGALGRVVVVAAVEAADAVLATRTKRTGKALALAQIANAARNARRPFLELSAVSPVRVMEAVEALTGLPVPEHLRQKPPQPVSYLPPLERDGSGSAAAFRLLSGGRSLPEYLIARAGPELPAAILLELDRTDLFDSRESLLSSNPQEREARRQRPLTRPYMEGSRMARKRLTRDQLKRREEVEGAVPW